MEWIGDGLRFGCTRCGACCSQSGNVWVTLAEIEAIATKLGLDVQSFGRRYLVRVGTRLSIHEDSRGRCLLLGDDNRCTVYDVRPRQCRSFPFWRSALASPEAWRDTGRLSPGVGRGRLYTRAEIESILLGEGAASDEGTEDEPEEDEKA